VSITTARASQSLVVWPARKSLKREHNRSLAIHHGSFNTQHYAQRGVCETIIPTGDWRAEGRWPANLLLDLAGLRHIGLLNQCNAPTKPYHLMWMQMLHQSENKHPLRLDSVGRLSLKSVQSTCPELGKMTHACDVSEMAQGWQKMDAGLG